MATVNPPAFVSETDRQRIKNELGRVDYARLLCGESEGSTATDEACLTAVATYYATRPGDPNKP